jgi:hypothetical protein
MKKLLIFAAIALLLWQGYTRMQLRELSASSPVAEPIAPLLERPRQQQSFACDGRVHCSQMTSCEEATWFINNCPGTKMDGNNDGVPCESQWCQ